MIKYQALSAITLLILPGSCIAAPAAPPAKPAPVTPTATVAKPLAPPRIGRFQLDRLPQQGSLARGQVPAGTQRLVVNGQDVDIAADGRFIIGFGLPYAYIGKLIAKRKKDFIGNFPDGL